jgi:diacylglycerol kinase (ATP)
MPRAVVIVNRQAAAGRDRSSRLASVLTDLRTAGYVPEVRTTEAPGHAVELARDAGTGPEDLLVVAGGDGTANEVASGRLRAGRTTTPIAVLPMGTGNDLAQLLGTGDDRRLLAALRGRRVAFRDVLAVETAADGLRAAMLFAAVGFASDLLL